jgi:hypothetical protein
MLYLAPKLHTISLLQNVDTYSNRVENRKIVQNWAQVIVVEMEYD